MSDPSPCTMLKRSMRDEVEAQGFYEDLMKALIRANYPGEANDIQRVMRDEEAHARTFLELARSVGCDVPKDVEQKIMEM